MGNTAPLPQFGKKTTSDEIGEKLGGYGANKYVVVTGIDPLNGRLTQVCCTHHAWNYCS
jgi:hypothetical protein